MSADLPLAGKTIALPETRQLEELALLLEKEGATPLRCPMVSIVDNPDAAPVIGWLQELAAGQFHYLVLMTGEALRRLLGFADREGMRAAVVAALAQVRKVTRGPKPVRALKEVGLQPDLIAEAPTTAGVIATLQREPLQGKTVGVTLYGEPNPELVDFVLSMGAAVKPVLPYLYAPAADAERVADLIRRMDQGEVDAIAFTSSPQVDRLWEVAQEQSLERELRQGLGKTCVAAVGPVVADALRERGITVTLCPERGFVMKNLVQLLARSL
jgi:uroporphyrinogen-III synthase